MRTIAKATLTAAALAAATTLAPSALAQREPGAGTMTQVQVRELLTAQGYTRIDDLEFEDGMWETDATSADGNRVDVRVDPATGKVYAEGLVSRLGAEDIKARLTAAGYSKVHDVDYDDGIWKAEAERPDGQNVEVRLDPKDGRILGVEND
ncbi:MAG TPA: PepSY domain-containing protein [Pseudoxanthomonas sp.]|nr:PepSY domain-containing protein [Pseudoxanthomonas sp.]